MRTVTQSFTNAWNDAGKKFAVREVRYKRRYWNGAAFVYEAAWKTLSMRDFVDIGTVTQNLDTVKLNEFKTSNLSLTLNNEENLWTPGNNYGYFGTDAVATSGYTAYKTMFQIWAGYELADETEEMLCVFAGFLVDYNFSPKTNKIEFTLIGYEDKLQSKDAQAYSTAFTNEATIPATGDAANKDFYTTSEGVAYLLSNGIKVGGVTQTEGEDYTISELGVYGGGAKITFAVAPGAGVAVTASGRKWYTLKKVEEIIADLCTLAGIDSADRDIATALFPNGVMGYKTISSQAEWVAGSVKTDVDTSTVPGDLLMANYVIDDFADNTISRWTITKGGANFLADNYKMKCVPTTSLSCIKIPSTRTEGSWQFTVSQIGGVFAPDYLNIFFMCSSEAGDGSPSDGYYISCRVSGISLRSYSGSTLISTATTLGVDTVIRVTRSALGVFKLYLNEVLIGTSAADLTYTASTNMYFTHFTADPGWVYYLIDNIRSAPEDRAVTKYPDTAVYESTEFDLLAAPSAWGVITKDQTLNGGTLTYYTAVADAPGGPYDAYVACSTDTGQINSALKRYLKIKIVLTPGTSGETTPAVHEIIASFTSTLIYIALVNMTGMTCYDAIQKLAKLCNYEWGFKGDGRFFFRSKATSQVPLFTFTQKDVVEVSSVKPGWNEIINVAQVRYDNSYYREYNSSSGPEATSPTSQQIYGDRIRSEEVTDFLLANDADLATGTAQVTHDDNYRAKLRVSLTLRAVPHLELSDPIQLNYTDDPLLVDPVMGDMLLKFGSAAFGGDDSRILFYERMFKVVGIRQQIDAAKTAVILEEIL